MKEINFNQSKKDLTEAKIHHLLSEEMAKPQKHIRKLSYSRHQLQDDDPKISYKTHTQVRRMMSEKRQRKKVVKTGNGEPVIKVTDEVDDGRVPGTNKLLLDEKVHEMLADDQDPPPPPYAPREEHGINLSPHSSLTVPGQGQSPRQVKRKSEIRTLLDATTTVADDHKPQWMIFHTHYDQKQTPGSFDNPAFEHEPATEAVLPWKREDSDIQLPAVAIKQREFPPWINNKDYVNYSSPSNTLLGRATEHRNSPSIIGYFQQQKRDSLSFLGEGDGWDSRHGSRRNSRDKDFLSVLTNPVNIRRTSAPPISTRQRSLSSLQPFDDDEDDTDSPSHLTPIIERKVNKPFVKKDTVLNFENEILKQKPHYQ